MKVIVLGATGSVGRLAVASLLAQGHVVTAFARKPGKLGIAHPALRVRAGDAMDADSVSSAMAGQDAVVITLGAGASLTSRVRSVGTANVIAAMREHGVRRLVCQSTLGVGDSWDNLDFFWKYLMFGLLLRPAFRDHQRQEKMVRESELDWTIVRPSAFTDEQPGPDLKVDFPPGDRGLALKIARKEIAAFLLRCIDEASFLHRAVAISH